MSSCLVGLKRERMNSLGKFSVRFLLQAAAVLYRAILASSASSELWLPIGSCGWFTRTGEQAALCDLFVLFSLSALSPGRNQIEKLADLNKKPPNLHKMVNISLLISFAYAQDLCMCFNVQAAGSWLTPL